MSEQENRPQRTNLTRDLPKPNAYAVALDTEFRDYAFNEERAPLNKGKWRSDVFKCKNEKPLDVEIGTGSGMHFAYQANKQLDRYLVGLEIKYKPLIQTIRRAQVNGAKNTAICRYHAFDLDLLFDQNEINNVYIHCPDPWVTPRKPKNRVVNKNILNHIYEMQRPGSFLEFKTDSREYFLWSLDEIKETKYRVEFQTLNLYKEGGKYFEENFQTSFEKIFVQQGVEINYIKLVKD
ncbi:MAG: tRNA (guanine-N7)-methyltransferase [Bdellovibrio sp.]|nr:tRNA (guanine-N7)-methyltransferase [Bdellovibrio sp.]